MLLTVTGSGFGATQGSGSATIGNVPISVLTWTDFQIVGAIAANTTSGTVTVQQGSLTITGPTFTITSSLPYQIQPQSLSMVVGDSRTVSVVDPTGKPVKSLPWQTTDSTIVRLSTDDPPVITAVAVGTATIYAGEVPLPVTVYASVSAMPPNTPIWSLPVSGAAGGLAQLYLRISHHESGCPTLRGVSKRGHDCCREPEIFLTRICAF